MNRREFLGVLAAVPAVATMPTPSLPRRLMIRPPANAAAIGWMSADCHADYFGAAIAAIAERIDRDVLAMYVNG